MRVILFLFGTLLVLMCAVLFKAYGVAAYQLVLFTVAIAVMYSVFAVYVIKDLHNTTTTNP